MKEKIKPCPNPDCRKKVVWDTDGEGCWFLKCNCGYKSPIAFSRDKTIGLHNGFVWNDGDEK